MRHKRAPNKLHRTLPPPSSRRGSRSALTGKLLVRSGNAVGMFWNGGFHQPQVHPPMAPRPKRPPARPTVFVNVTEPGARSALKPILATPLLPPLLARSQILGLYLTLIPAPEPFRRAPSHNRSHYQQVLEHYSALCGELAERNLGHLQVHRLLDGHGQCVELAIVEQQAEGMKPSVQPEPWRDQHNDKLRDHRYRRLR